MADVIVIGDLDTDQFYLVPRIPTWDEGVLVDTWYEYPGGKGGNTAAALSRLGTSTGIIASIGDDHFGKLAISGMVNSGVATQGVTTVPGGKTYYCIMMLDETGEKAILVVHTDLTYPDQKMVEAHYPYLRSARHLHVIGLDPMRMLPAISIAKQAGLTISIDLDAAYTGYSTCLPAINAADIVFLNRLGAERLFPDMQPEDVVREISRHGPSFSVVTQGTHGAIARDTKETIRTSAHRVKTVDTTGAGDAFSAAFIHAFLNGWGLEKALTFSSAVASLSTTAIGGQNALPSEQEAWSFISSM